MDVRHNAYVRRCPGRVLERWEDEEKGNNRGECLHRCSSILIFIVMEEVQSGYWHGIFWCSVEMCDERGDGMGV